MATVVTLSQATNSVIPAKAGIQGPLAPCLSLEPAPDLIRGRNDETGVAEYMAATLTLPAMRPTME